MDLTILYPDAKSGGFTICIDLLDHGFFQPGEKTGWTPAYTLSTVLLQMQAFFSQDYDLPILPNKIEIENLKINCKKYRVEIEIDEGLKIHCSKEPYPKIYLKKNQQMDLQKKSSKDVSLNKLTCYLTRNNAEDSSTLLGYPMHLKRDKFGRIHVVPILEIRRQK